MGRSLPKNGANSGEHVIDLRANTDRMIKITVPGPFTMAQQAQNDIWNHPQPAGHPWTWLPRFGRRGDHPLAGQYLWVDERCGRSSTERLRWLFADATLHVRFTGLRALKRMGRFRSEGRADADCSPVQHLLAPFVRPRWPRLLGSRPIGVHDRDGACAFRGLSREEECGGGRRDGLTAGGEASGARHGDIP